MLQLLKAKVSLRFLVNPFFLYCIAFSFAIIVYLLGWSNIFPPLSAGLLLFFAITFSVFIPAGIYLHKKGLNIDHLSPVKSYLNEIIFGSILFLGLLNVLYMGYLPILDRSHNYREFGMPVIDPLFNTLSIFFSVFMVHSFLYSRRKKYLFFTLIILVIQVLLYRRSTIIWIFTSSSFLYILFKKKIKLWMLLACIVSVPLLSLCFGIYGNTRSHLTRSFVIDDLGASERFNKTGLSYNHYMTYLYISSPLANLQENLIKRNADLNKSDFKDFLFYCLIPESVTLRLEKSLNISRPECYLISPNLIVGSFYMTAFFLLGWSGMIIIFLSLIVFIVFCLFLIKKYSSFGIEAYSILSAFVCLLIFANFMNRLDVYLMLFIYPVLFHLIYTPGNSLKTVNEE